MPRPFNVTVIQPPQYIHSAALYEAAEYLQDLIGRSGAYRQPLVWLDAFRRTDPLSAFAPILAATLARHE